MVTRLSSKCLLKILSKPFLFLVLPPTCTYGIKTFVIYLYYYCLNYWSMHLSPLLFTYINGFNLFMQNTMINQLLNYYRMKNNIIIHAPVTV